MHSDTARAFASNLSPIALAVRAIFNDTAIGEVTRGIARISVAVGGDGYIATMAFNADEPITRGDGSVVSGWISWCTATSPCPMTAALGAIGRARSACQGIYAPALAACPIAVG